MELDYISTQLLNDIIKMTSLISPVIEIMKNDMILSKASPHFVDSYQQFKDVLIKTRKSNRISEDNLDIIIIFFNNLRSLYYNIHHNEDTRKVKTKLYKYWAIFSRFTAIIGMFIVRNYKFFSLGYVKPESINRAIEREKLIKERLQKQGITLPKDKKDKYSQSLISLEEINVTNTKILNEELLETLRLIPEKEKKHFPLNNALLYEIKNEEFGQVSNLVSPEGEYNYTSVFKFNNEVFKHLKEIYEELDKSLDDIKSYVIDFFNAKLESINANIKIIIGKDIIDTNELEKNLQEFSDIANEEKFKEILSLLSLYNKVDKNKNDFLTLLTIFEKIKKEYHTDTNFIKDIDEIITNFTTVLKENKEIYIYKLYILLKTKYKLIELYNEYKEKRFLDNDLESFIKPIEEYIDIYENFYFYNMNKTYRKNEQIKPEELETIEAEERIEREEAEKIKKEEIKEKRWKEIIYNLVIIGDYKIQIIEDEIKKIIDKFKITQTELFQLIVDSNRHRSGKTKYLFSYNVWDILNKLYNEKYAEKYRKDGGSKKSKRVLKRLS